MMHNWITCNPNAMETVVTLCSEVDIRPFGRAQAACSIWWTPVTLQATEENKRSHCDSAVTKKAGPQYSSPSMLQAFPRPSAWQLCGVLNLRVHSPNGRQHKYNEQRTAIKVSTPIWSARQHQVLGAGSKSTSVGIYNDSLHHWHRKNKPEWPVYFLIFFFFFNLVAHVLTVWSLLIKWNWREIRRVTCVCYSGLMILSLHSLTQAAVLQQIN